VTAQLRSELLKHRSTRTDLGLLSALLGLVALAVLLHGFSLPADHLDSEEEQLSMLVGWGEKLGVLFAGLVGAMSITNEIRHGTIRPTFLVTPKRTRIVVAKVVTAMLAGAAFGLIAIALAVAAGGAALEARGVDNHLDAGAYALLTAGSATAAALWAAIGVGIGAVVRNQVPALVGICAWLLFVEGLLLGDLFSAVGSVSRFAPGAAAAAISGQDPDQLLAPALALLLLAAYAVVSAMAGAVATARRDVP
jgi:ABC-2 type transport system permease protein